MDRLKEFFMIVGVPTEVKNHEYRVAITAAGVDALVRRGHTVVVQEGAGVGSSIADDEYRDAGAAISSVDEVWNSAELLLKVKEPVESEYARLRSSQTVFTYLHLAADLPLVTALLDRGVTALAYETVRTADGLLPLLAPMSEIAGRLAVHAGVYHLQRTFGGRGVLASGAPGVAPADVVIIGAGAAGENAMREAIAIGANVTILDLSIPRLREIDRLYPGRVTTIASTAYAIDAAARRADILIGAALVPGARAPKLVSHDLVARMREGSVLVDIAIDQGGCFEDSRPTTHDEPTFAVEKSIFYCVANMPGAVPATSTAALTNVTLPYVLALAEKGWKAAANADTALAAGLNTSAGRIVNSDVAASFPQFPSVDSRLVLAS
jgi:alanine dehydrogenase